MAKEPREINAKSLRLQAASREDDGFFSTFILRKISLRITSVLVEKSVTPNTVTLFSLVIGLIAAYISAQGNYIAGGSLFLLSLVLDCVDGEIARYKNKFSALGAWLDALSDRIKEFVYIFALIYSIDEVQLWWSGIIIVALQTVRHLSDYNFAKLQKFYEEESKLSSRAGAIYWIKKVIHLPIGERWLLLAVVPIFFSIEQTLRIIISLSVISFCYALLTRFRRMRLWKSAGLPIDFLNLQRDLLLPLNLSGSKASWLFPSLFRALEFASLLLITSDVSPFLKFILVFAIALWHYANLYDALQGRATYRGAAGLRVAGRISLCFAAQLLSLEVEVVIFLSIYLLALISLRGGHNVLGRTK